MPSNSIMLMEYWNNFPSTFHQCGKMKQAPVGYKCTTAAACKYLWRCAVEQQLFFTLANSVSPPKVKSGGNIFSRGSKFRFSGRCQQEAYTASEKIDRSEPDLVRTSSLPNYARKVDSRPNINKFNTIGYGNAIKEANNGESSGQESTSESEDEISIGKRKREK
ncbi:unnamed protein product [Mytilus edulis]|uniref:FERM adjacent domain-containing protein n=1 Tax=Mytilus edulis TaxID=6550 RepID=A0A8S3QK49_MYTED|nr:unnamed protein product [Mytilus edulis]